MQEKVREIIFGLIRHKKNMAGLGEDDNYFDLGVSSLTIVELQIGVEEALGVTIPTSRLMKMSTIRGWIDAYSAVCVQQGRDRTAGMEAGSSMGVSQ